MLSLLSLLIAANAASPVAPPGRDKELLHKHVEQVVAEKEAEQEQALRRMLSLGGSAAEQAEALGRLAALLRSRGLTLAIRAQREADEGDEAAAQRDRTRSADSRAEAISRYRELLKKYPDAPRTDEALFFLADTLQDSQRDQEAVQAARELTKRFPKSVWAPSSHVFIGEHLFEEAKLAEALKEYRLAAEVPSDEVYAYALYKAAWCRFNQSAFTDTMKLLERVVALSSQGTEGAGAEGGGTGGANRVQLGKEARRDYVLAFSRVGKPEAAQQEFVTKFGAGPGKKMLEQYGKLLFDQARDPEAQLINRQLLALHGDAPAAALDQTRLLVIASRGGKRKDIVSESHALVQTFSHVNQQKDEALDEANRLAEETLRKLAVEIHNEARKTDLDDTWSAARAVYDDYLKLFPQSEQAYELRFFEGELLYSRDDKAAAAPLYEAVTAQDRDAIQNGQKPGRWLQKAAWSAVLSRSEVIDKSGALKKDLSAQRKLTDDEVKLADACRLYLAALPEGPHAVEVAFKVGRLEYIGGDLPAAEKHLAWVALDHPEHELAEYAANLVLDTYNLRKDWAGLHSWAVRFMGDQKLASHGTLAQDFKRIEEESAYALADGAQGDSAKAQALLAFVDAHPHGALADKALFGASAALSRAGRIDDALAARERVWKEQQGSPLVARAILSSAADHAQVGDLGEAAGLLEKYAQLYKKEQDTAKWRREHPPAKAPAKKPELWFTEAQAQSGLRDATLLREARGELKQALADRALSMQLWPKAADHDEQVMAQSLLRAKLGENSRAARELAGLAKSLHGKPALQLTAWREAARLFARVHETGNTQWSWNELEREFKALGPKAREKLTPEALTAAAEAHQALSAKAFDEFKQQQIKAPLMVNLNRKIARLQAVKKRTVETVGMRQAEPAVCALLQLGEAQWLLGQALAQSPFPPGLTAEQKKLYRAALDEKAQPLYGEARETLKSADDKARELGVQGTCPARVATFLEKLGGKAADRQKLDLAPLPLIGVPEPVDGEGAPLAQAEIP